MWWRKDKSRRLRHVDLDRLASLAGDDWTTVWRKLEVEPNVVGTAVVGEVTVHGNRVQPIVGFTGYASRDDVLECLTEQLGISLDESSKFLDCTIGRDFIVAHLEAQLAGLAPDAGS